MRIAAVLFPASFAVASAFPAASHEFWISPHNYTIGPEDQLVADIRVGPNFSGPPYPYIPQLIERFGLVTGESETPVGGRAGDLPAMSFAPPEEGLAVIVHQTTDDLAIYSNAEEYAEFEEFARQKGFPWAIEEHAERGLPETGFAERYSRYAKSLVAIGHGRGSDRATGLLTEIVAEANPYTDDLSAGLPVRALYRNAPRADAQIEVFARDAVGRIRIARYRTDALGRATVPVEPGTEYLLDSVVMRAVTPRGESDPVWESLWASLTFRIPAK